MKLKKELPLIAIVLLPFIYLAVIWNQLPDQVPLHWNLQGEVDRYGDKQELLLIPVLLPLLTYLIFVIVPKIDPKNKLNKMGNKLQTVKALMTTLMSLLALAIIYSANNESFITPKSILILIGVLYLILGNYFKTIKPNYFIGIRTPWTLESETVWKETHRLGGVLWVIGGILTVILAFILPREPLFIVFGIITVIMIMIPFVYSYIRFEKQKNQSR